MQYEGRGKVGIENRRKGTRGRSLTRRNDLRRNGETRQLRTPSRHSNNPQTAAPHLPRYNHFLYPPILPYISSRQTHPYPPSSHPTSSTTLLHNPHHRNPPPRKPSTPTSISPSSPRPNPTPSQFEPTFPLIDLHPFYHLPNKL